MKKRWILILFPIVMSLFVIGVVIPKLEKDTYDFTLQSAQGEVRLSDFRYQKAVAVYFGYTSCPDICPTSLSTLASAMRRLNEEDAKKLEVIFISVDPERDSLENLEAYAQYFYPTFRGVTGDPEILKKLAKTYGTHYARVDLNDSAMGYSVAHTSFVYFFNRSGYLSGTLNHSIDPEETARYMREAIAE